MGSDTSNSSLRSRLNMALPTDRFGDHRAILSGTGQNVIGLFYYWLTGRRPLGMEAELYGPMVIISLICVCLLVAGIVAGDALVARTMKPRLTRYWLMP